MMDCANWGTVYSSTPGTNDSQFHSNFKPIFVFNKVSLNITFMRT